MINSKNTETVKPTPEDVAEARRLDDDPRLLRALVDLVFLAQEEGRCIPS